MSSNDSTAYLDTILRSPQFAGWQERLSVCFYEKELRDTLIRELREAVAAPAPHLPPQEMEQLQKTVIGQLIGLASSATSRPTERSEPPPPAHSPEEIEDLVIEGFPYPIASCYSRLVDSEAGAGAFGSLLDTLESLLHYLTTVVLSVYWREGAPDARHNHLLLDKLYKGKWSAGELLGLLRDTVKLYRDRPGALPYPQLSSYLFTRYGKPSSSLRVLEGLVELRNRAWGHGAGRDDWFYASILPQNRQRLQEELSRCEWLTAGALWLPKEIDDSGRITRADLFKGSRRRKDRAVLLQIQSKDLDINGGDITPERTLLLTEEKTGYYLPLFPFSLFHYQQTGQGQFFLNDLDWAAKAERLRRVRFIAYDPSLPDHEARAGDPAAVGLETRVRQLAVALRDQGISLPEVPLSAGATADYNLPEVWIEQASHLKAFVGRTAWLKRLKEWVEGTAGGGYFLLLGPPGQGKSALLAQLVDELGPFYQPDISQHEDSPRAACLLHMVKSHKNPRRFLQFLIWQAERLAGKPPETASYEGSVEDLRNVLVGLLEDLAKGPLPVLVVIDALDELEIFGDRLDFLPPCLPDRVRLVLSCRPHIPLVSTLQRRLHLLLTEDLIPLEAADLPLLMERYLEPVLIQELGHAVDFEALFAHTGGNPLFLRRAIEHILEEIRRADGGSLPAIDVTTFPVTVDAVFEDIYNQVAEKTGGQFSSELGRIKAVLVQILSVAREPVSVEELQGLLQADFSGLSLEATRDLVVQVSQYLLSYDGERFLLFHQGFSDYLQRKILGEDGLAAAHRAFSRWLATPLCRQSLYRLRNLPAHLRQEAVYFAVYGMEEEAKSAFQRLEALLTTLDFVEAKVKAGMTYDLIRDYEDSMTALYSAGLKSSVRIQEWSQFVSRESHILTADPDLFLQQAINQPAASPVAQAAEDRSCSSSSGHWLLRWLNKPGEMVQSPLVRTMTGHTGAVNTTIITIDGAKVISGSSDRSLKAWDLQSGRCLATLQGHTESVEAVGVSEDGKYGVSGCRDGSIRVWDLHSEQCLTVLQGHRGPVNAVALTPDSKRVLSAGLDKILKVWDLSTGQTLFSLPIRALTFSQDARIVVSSYGNARQRVWGLEIWDLESGQCLAGLEGHKGLITTAVLIRGGKHLVSGSTDRTLKLWNMQSGQCLTTLFGHSSDVKAVAASPDGKLAVSGSWDATLKVWNLESGECISTLVGHTGWVQAVAVAQDGKQAVSGSCDGTVKLWSLQTERHLSVTLEQQEVVNAIVLTPDGRRAISGTLAGKVKVWDLAAGQCLSTLQNGSMSIEGLALTTDGKWVVSGSGGALDVWNLETGAHVAVITGHTHAVKGIVAVPNRMLAVSGCWDGKLRLWNLSNGQCLSVFDGHILTRSVAIAPDGTRVLSGSEDGTLKLWDLETAQCILTFFGHATSVSAIAITPDGSHAISASYDQTLRVWELQTGTCLRSFHGHSAPIETVAIATDGKQVISGSSDSTLRVWDLDSGKCLATFPTPGAVRACAISSDRSIVCGGEFNQLYRLKLEHR